MVIRRPLLALPGAPEQPAATLQCSAVLGANRRLMMQTQSSSAAAAPSKALPFSGSTKQVPGSICFFVCSVYAC